MPPSIEPWLCWARRLQASGNQPDRYPPAPAIPRLCDHRREVGVKHGGSRERLRGLSGLSPCAQESAGSADDRHGMLSGMQRPAREALPAGQAQGHQSPDRFAIVLENFEVPVTHSSPFPVRDGRSRRGIRTQHYVSSPRHEQALRRLAVHGHDVRYNATVYRRLTRRRWISDDISCR